MVFVEDKNMELVTIKIRRYAWRKAKLLSDANDEFISDYVSRAVELLFEREKHKVEYLFKDSSIYSAEVLDITRGGGKVVNDVLPYYCLRLTRYLLKMVSVY